ncbi:hypothetical protein D3C81_1539450 [compost metagenome]
MFTDLTGTDNDRLGHHNEYYKYTFYKKKFQQRLVQHCPFQAEIKGGIKQEAEHPQAMEQLLVEIYKRNHYRQHQGHLGPVHKRLQHKIHQIRYSKTASDHSLLVVLNSCAKPHFGEAHSNDDH